MNFLIKFRQLLSKADLSELARRTGYSYQYLWRVSKGYTCPSASRIDRILDFLDYKFMGDKQK